MATSGPGEAHSERRLQLAIAGIAAGAALVGALVGGIASYLGTNQQIEAQAEQARANYLRSERRATYAAMLESDQKLRRISVT